MIDYKEQIKSPEWQKRRLEIMQKDNFTCQICGRSDKTLNVHHLIYRVSSKIHEYTDKELITLCEDCHNKEHNYEKGILSLIRYIKSKGITNHEIYSLLSCWAIQLNNGNDKFLIKTIGNTSGLVECENDLFNLSERRSI